MEKTKINKPDKIIGTIILDKFSRLIFFDVKKFKFTFKKNNQ